jgi:hypothetical protein
MTNEEKMPKKADRLNRIYKIESEGNFSFFVFNPE